ncbi:hypothetical protein PGB90_007653 [Kerria lacca]
MDDEDEEKLNRQINDLQTNSENWKNMALDNVGLIKDTLKEVKSKSQQFQNIQEEFQKELLSITTAFSQQKLSHVYEQFFLQYELLYNSLKILQETILFAPFRINPALIHPIKIFENTNNCEYRVFTRKNATTEHCKLITLPVTYEVWIYLSNNQWLFSQSSSSSAELTRADGETLTLNLPLSGLSTLPHRSTLTTKTHDFIGHDKYNSTLNHITGNFEFTQITPLEITTNVTYNISDFNIKTLSRLEERWEQEKERIKNIKSEENQNFFIHSLSFMQILIITVIVLIIVYKLYKCYKFKRNISNDFNINFTTSTPHLESPVTKKAYQDLYLHSLPHSVDELTEQTEDFGQITKTTTTSRNPSPKRISFYKPISSRFPFKSPF